MSDFDFSPRGQASTRLVGNVSNMPSIQLIMEDGGFHMDVILETEQARHLGHMLLGLSSEADAQAGYITTLRSHKLTEEEIMDIVTAAAQFISAGRMK